MSFPESITMDFAEEHTGDTVWAAHIMDNHISILDNYCGEDYPRFSNCLAHTLICSVAGKGMSAHTYEVNRVALNIARIGLNYTMEPSYEISSIQDSIHTDFYRGDLLFSMATAILNCNRPIAAMGYLDNAEKSYLHIKQLFEDEKNDCYRDASIAYERCRAKEAEIYLCLIPILPKKHRAIMSSIAHSYISHSLYHLENFGDFSGVKHYSDYFNDSLYYCSKYPFYSQFEIDEMNRDTITDDYVRWVNNSCMYLNIFNEVPHNNARYAEDDVRFDLEERYEMLLDDILHTNDHCRKLIYPISKIPMEDLIVKDRDDDVESLLDCYSRLYTILDKFSKIIVHLFSLDIDGNITFHNVAEHLRGHHNPYLSALFDIQRDIFPDRVSTINRDFDPRCSVYGVVLKSGFVRNSIMHNTLHICKDSESRGVYEGVASITPFELYNMTVTLYHNVREIILSVQLALEYRKNE